MNLRELRDSMVAISIDIQVDMSKPACHLEEQLGGDNIVCELVMINDP